jgi:hypothetical protein
LIHSLYLIQLRVAVNALRAAAGLTAMPFTQPSLPGKSVKAVDYTELQNAINGARVALGVPAVSFLPVVAGGWIQDEHVTDLQGAVR